MSADSGTSEAIVAALRHLADGDAAATPTTGDPAIDAALATLRERMDSVRERAEHAEDVIERLPVGFFRNSLTDGSLIYANEANARLLGYRDFDDAKQLLRASRNAYVNPEDREVLKQAMVTEGRIDGFRTAVRLKSGAIGYVEVSARMYPKEGAVEGVMIDYSASRIREEELRAVSETLRERNDQLEQKQTQIDALSLPLIEVWERAICVPLIGVLDRMRTRRLMEEALQEVVRRQARVLFVDMTGIHSVDTATAHNLLSLARGVKLLGSQTVLCGIRSEVAQTFVSLDVELDGIELRSSLQEALAVFIRESRQRAAKQRRTSAKPAPK
ncbi:MAG: STAS domain-containing protein [Nannocystaceae bacterium]